MLKYNDKELDFEELKDKEIILFGASTFGIKLKNIIDTFEFEKEGGGVKYFVDNNIDKWNNYIDGIRVLPLDKFINYCRDNPKKVVIFISSSFNGIEEQLNLYKLKNKIYIYDVLYKYIVETFFKSNKDIQDLYNLTKANYNRFCSESKLFYTLIDNYINNFFYWVYSIPKTGNNSIISSLETCGLGVYYNSIHSIDSNILNKFDSTDKFENIWSNLKKGNIKIITMVRDPLAQQISLFFQVIYSYYLSTENNSYDLQKMFDNIFVYNTNTYKYNDRFLDLYLNNNRYKNFEVWFEKEIKANLGIDVFEHKFDKNRGYSSIHKNNIDVLIIKLEKINELEHIIGDFVNITNFKLQSENNSDQKVYKREYATFKENFRISKDYVNKLYSSKYIKHFYSEEEIDCFKKKWEKNIV